MFDFRKELSVLLEDSQYQYKLGDQADMILEFEGPSVMGFVFVYDSVASLVESWSENIDAAMNLKSNQLLTSGEKGWNVYAIFLTSEKPNDEELWVLKKIEEDLRNTRKIAKGGIETRAELRSAVIPILRLHRIPEGLATELREFLSQGNQEFVEVINAVFEGVNEEGLLELLGGE